MCASHPQEIRTAHQVPKEGKIISYPMFLHVRRVELAQRFLLGQGVGGKEANRTKFTKLCFLLSEIGKGSSGNNDQV